MRLEELKKKQANRPPMPVIAWLEPSKGPEDIRGVRLAYIQPIKPHYDQLIAYADEEAERGNDREAERAKRLRKMQKEYLDSGQTYFTPDLGWWMNAQSFEEGKEGFGGSSKGKLQAKYPNLRIVQSREEAVRQAKEAGII